VLSSHAVDGHRMYFGGSVVGKASTIQSINQSINQFISRHSTEARATVRLCRIKDTDGIQMSLCHPLIFTGGQNVWNLASFSTPLNYEPFAFEYAARYPNAETKFECRYDRPMPVPSLVKLGSRTPENRWVEMPDP